MIRKRQGKFYGLILLISFLISCTPKNEERPAMNASSNSTPPSSYSAPDFFEIVPGKSLGDVVVGETSDSLKQKKFSENKEYSLSESYLHRDGLNARLENGKVVQIWVDDELIGKMRYQGKPLPDRKSAESLRRFFSSCEKDVIGSGGIMIYCDNRGLRLDFRYPNNQFMGLNVVAISDYENVVQKK